MESSCIKTEAVDIKEEYFELDDYFRCTKEPQNLMADSCNSELKAELDPKYKSVVKAELDPSYKSVMKTELDPDYKCVVVKDEPLDLEIVCGTSSAAGMPCKRKEVGDQERADLVDKDSSQRCKKKKVGDQEGTNLEDEDLSEGCKKKVGNQERTNLKHEELAERWEKKKVGNQERTDLKHEELTERCEKKKVGNQERTNWKDNDSSESMSEIVNGKGEILRPSAEKKKLCQQKLQLRRKSCIKAHAVIQKEAEVHSLVTSEEKDDGAMEPPKLKKTRSENSSTESSKQRKLNQRRGVIDDIMGDGPTPGQAIDGFIRECTRIWRPQEKTQPKVPHWQMQIKSFCDMIEHQLSDDQVDKRFLPDLFMELSAAIIRFSKIQGDCVPSHLMHHLLNKYSVQPTTTALNATSQALGPTTTQSAFGVVPPNLQAPLPVCHPPPHTQPPLTAAQVNQVINALGGGVRPLGSGTISPGFGDMNMSFSSLPSNPSLSAFLDTATPRNSPSRAPSRSSQSSSLPPLNE